MGAGVNHAVRRQAMRQINVRARVTKAKLQHSATGNLMALSQGVHLGCDKAQVFSKEWKAAESFTKFVEQFVLGTVHPTSVYRGWLAGGDLPELLESAKVIETDVVASLRRPAQAVNPPIVASRFHGIPVVQRTAPALASCAECIWRNSGNRFGLEIVLQAKKVTVSPYVSAVIVHKDRDISHYAD